MGHSRGWLAPPTRREFTLLLFSLTVFVLSYNLETSLRFVGVHPEKSTYLSTIGLGGKDPGFDPDGRRPKEYRDDLEKVIFGDWPWEEGRVAGVDRNSVGVGLGEAAVFNGPPRKRAAKGSAGALEDRGIGLGKGVSVHEQFVRWGDNVPVTKALAHVPGYTILDNVLIANGTFFLITDDAASLPPPAAIASSVSNPGLPPAQNWEVLSTQEARMRLGGFGGRIYGASWIATDPSDAQDPYTLLSLYRTHNALAGPDNHAVSAPVRLMFPYIPTFSSPYVPPPDNNEKTHPPPRIRSYNGLHPLLPKAIVPTLGVWYAEDWDDIAAMNVPWLLERVVVADRGAAERGRETWARQQGSESSPSWAAPFLTLRASEGWWAPMRKALLRYVGIPEEESSSWGSKKTKPVVTYISMQDEPFAAGPRLHDQNHEALVNGLEGLQREGVIGELHVVRGNGSVPGAEWEARMKAIARSSVVLGPYGPQLADSVYMGPATSQRASAPSTASQAPISGPLLMEFFPPGTYVPDQEFAVRAVGLRYMAWWNDRKFAGDLLPPVMPPDEASFRTQRVPVDPAAVVQAVREDLARR